MVSPYISCPFAPSGGSEHGAANTEVEGSNTHHTNYAHTHTNNNETFHPPSISAEMHILDCFLVFKGFDSTTGHRNSLFRTENCATGGFTVGLFPFSSQECRQRGFLRGGRAQLGGADRARDERGGHWAWGHYGLLAFFLRSSSSPLFSFCGGGAYVFHQPGKTDSCFLLGSEFQPSLKVSHLPKANRPLDLLWFSLVGNHVYYRCQIVITFYCWALWLLL